MMKLVFFMLFMMPLSMNKKLFWLNLFMYKFFFFFFMLTMFSYNYMNLSISYNFSLDLLSYMMIMLTLWICSLMILASEKLYKSWYFSKLFLFMILLLVVSLTLTFSTMNLLLFYIFFEMSLIPMLILIIGWGYQPERLQAGIYLLFYTLLASFPMLLSIFYYYNMSHNLIFYYFNDMNYLIMYLGMNLVFFVKMPMYFVHLWLPKAHVEAPVSGSMMLAGVMLKLGGYGLMRVMKMFIFLGVKYNYVWIVISLIGGIYVSMMCLRQMDMKSLIAYSSVSHMGLVLCGVLTLSYWGLCGAFLMMIAHGLCSSGLFCLANMNYERINSRNLYLNKGLMNIMPNLAMWWFLFSISNMSAPPSLNLIGEILLINSMIFWNMFSMFILIFLLFFSAAYSLYLYSYTQHGKLCCSLHSFSMPNLREFLLLFLHWVPLNILILKSEYFILWV
uniref:NADH-ubiquinone oxidoreductase chain 4 n=1 Tax=Ochthebius colveranus TaxID=723409 RepID=A0A7H0DLA8_9COLE|nr:NADH dehydrogenase subunit 4 [Ochthebius colveranus]